jgi:hypothetical protein
MKKEFILIILGIFILQSVYALNLEIEKTSENEIMVIGVNKPAIFDLHVTNIGADANIEFYNLVGFRMFPAGTVPIKTSEEQDIKLEVVPIGEFDHIGAYTFNYFIRDEDGSEIEQTLTFRRIPMVDAFEIGAADFDPDSSSVQVYVRNREYFNFGKAKVKLTSTFFNFEDDVEIEPKETEIFTIELNKEEFKQLVAGFYTMNAEIEVDKTKAELETTLRFVEKNIVTSTENDFGLVINTKTIKKTNEGNVLAPVETSITKNIISRLFTSFSPEPDSVQRDGFTIKYTWSSTLNPGESQEIRVKTNWLFPFLIILLLIAVVLLAKQYSKTNLSLTKNVTFVRAKGGEFALKVSVFVKAEKYIEKVHIVDRLPPLVKIYEKFGVERPSRVDEKAKRIEWYFDKLEAGETRVINYIIYSKVGVLGRFALPSTKGIFEKDGSVHETESNRAFFVAEQQSGKEMIDEE